MEQDRGVKIWWEAIADNPGSVRIFLKGQMTWPHVKTFQNEINKALSSGFKSIELDLRELEYVDSAALASFIPVNERIKQQGGALTLSHPRKLIKHIFVSSNLAKIFTIID